MMVWWPEVCLLEGNAISVRMVVELETIAMAHICF